MPEISVIARRVLEGHRRRNPRPARRKAIELKDFLEGQHPRDYRGRFRRKIGPIPMATRNWLGRAMRKSKVRRRNMPPTPLALMVCTGQPDMDRYAAPGMARLLVPDMHDAARATEADGVPFACDNGGFFGVDEKKFKDMCEQMAAQHVHPLWVTAPDVLIHQPDGSVRGDARATVRRFEEWEQYLHHLGLPAALVAQDDMDEPDMLEWLDSHWDKVDAIFIGGSDDFKLGPGAAKITKLAQEHGKFVHMGRVNTAMRLVYARDMLGVDSVDGQNWNKFKDQKLPGGLTFIPSGEGPPTTMGKRWLDAVWKAIETGSPWPRPPRPNAKLADFLDSNGNWRLFFDRPGPTPALAKALAPQPVVYFAPLSDLMYECGLSDQAQLHFMPGKAGFSVDFVERWQLDSFVRLMQLPEPRVDGQRASWPDVLIRPGDADEYAAEEKALGVDWGESGEWVETGAAVPALLEAKDFEERLHPRDWHGRWAHGLGLARDLLPALASRQERGRKLMRVRPQVLIAAADARTRPGSGSSPTRYTEPVAGKTGQEDALKTMASRRRLGLQAYLAATRKRVRWLTAEGRAHVAVRVSSRILPTVLDEGHLVSAIDPGHREDPRDPNIPLEHKPATYVEPRHEWEHRVFSIEGESPADHPVYGYLAEDNEDVPAGAVGAWGDVKLRLKDAVRERSTFTYSDSNYIDVGNPDSGVVPMPVNSSEQTPVEMAVAPFMDVLDVSRLTPDGAGPNPLPPLPAELQRERDRLNRIKAGKQEGLQWGPGWEEAEKDLNRRIEWWQQDLEEQGKHHRWNNGDFFETQIHGGVTVDDIESVVFTSEPDPAITTQLDDLGISWKVELPKPDGKSVNGLEGLGTTAGELQLKAWEGRLHPRDRHGRFARKPGGGADGVPAILDEIDRIKNIPNTTEAEPRLLRGVGAMLAKELDRRRTEIERPRKSMEKRAKAIEGEMDQIAKQLLGYLIGSKHKIKTPDDFTPELRAERDRLLGKQDAKFNKLADLHSRIFDRMVAERREQREATVALLGEIRPMGGVLRRGQTTWHTQEWPEGSTALPQLEVQHGLAIHDARRCLPRDWIDQMNERGVIDWNLRRRVRAQHQGVPMLENISKIDDSSITISPDAGAGTYLHEIVHRIQGIDGMDTQRHIAQLEMLNERLGNDADGKVRPLKEFQGGEAYEPDEVGLPDGFPTVYYGKMYGAYYRPSNELLTMAVQDLFFNPERLRKDQGTYQWILGLLATM